MGPGKPLLLLARLLNEPAGLQREELASFLWDKMPDHRARASLRQALHLLRQVLGPDVIDGDRLQVRLMRPVAADLTAFLTAVREGDSASAVLRYAGPFLEDLLVADAHEAEQWVSSEQRRLSLHFVESATDLLTRQVRIGTPSDLLSRRLLEADRSRVTSWELRLETLSLADNQAGMRETLAELRRAMVEEDGIGAAERTEARRLVARYAAGEPSLDGVADAGTGLLGQRTRFVGRRHELLQLRSFWDGVHREQRGVRLLVSGHAGIGKSRLLMEFAQWPARDGATVLWVRARRGGRNDRLAYLVDLLDVLTSRPGSIGIMQESAAALLALAPSLVSLFPGVARQPAVSEDPAPLASALRDLLLTLAEERPLALLLDDLHAADAASLQVLEAATASLEGVRLAVVAASRPRPSLFSPPWPTITLGPLAEDQVAAIVAEIEQVHLEPQVAALLATTTGGVPLHAVQAIRALAARGLITRVDRTWYRVPTSGTEAIPTPRDLVLEVVASRSPAARRTLAALALGDAPFSIAELQHLARIPIGMRELLHELETTDLVQRVEEDRWQVGHDVVADSALHHMPLDQRRELSLALATHLTPGATGITEMRRVVRHYLDADAPDAMLEAVRRWHARTPEAPRGKALADVLLGSGGAPAIRRRLTRLVPRAERARRQLAVAMVGTAMLMGAVLLFWLRQPARLELINTPTYAFEMGVPPLFEVRNRLGQLVTSLDGQVATVTLARGADSISGTRSDPIRDGILSLDSLRVWEALESSGKPVELEIATSGLPRTRFTLRAPKRDSLWLEDGVLAGQVLAPMRPEVRVRPGAPIEGWVRVRYNSQAPAILLMMTQLATWVPPEQDTTTLTSLITPAQRAFLQVPKIRYVAPPARGQYWMAWLFAPEPAAVWIASSTSWRCGAPVWGDGNEKHRLGDSAFTSVWGRGGQVPFEKLLCEPGEPRRFMTNPIVMVAVRVIVE